MDPRGLYVEMLGLAERGYLPIAHSDWPDELDERYLTAVSTIDTPDVQLPMPPPGEAEAREDTGR